MTHKNYETEIEYDADAEIFHGRVRLVRDVVTFEGQSIEELKRELAASLEDYFAWCKARGEAPEAPAKTLAHAA